MLLVLDFRIWRGARSPPKLGVFVHSTQRMIVKGGNEFAEPATAPGRERIVRPTGNDPVDISLKILAGLLELFHSWAYSQYT